MIDAAAILTASKIHGMFLNNNLQPVTPKPGQWFVEADVDYDIEGEPFVQYGALVEYVQDGSRCVCEEGSDDVRPVRSTALILQA